MCATRSRFDRRDVSSAYLTSVRWFHLLKSWRQILDWSNVQRSIVTLSIYAMIEVVFLLWKLLLVLPIMGDHVNRTLIEQHLPIAGMLISTPLLTSLFFYIYRQNTRLQQFMPVICTVYISCTLCYHAYLIGTMTAATGILLIGAGMMGILLFERRLVYSLLVFAMVLLTGLTYLSCIHVLPYGPMFLHQDPFPANPVAWLLLSTLLYSILLFGVIGVFDGIIQEWRYQSARTLRLSQTDALTSLFNRRSFNQYITHHSRLHQPLSLILIDVDHFKKINDQCGHLEGDRVLQEIAKALKQGVRQGDWVGRYGGEEFVIVLPNTSIEQALDVAERCRALVHHIHVRHPADLLWQVSISGGVVFTKGPFEIKHILNLADERLYRAKAQGRDQMVWQD